MPAATNTAATSPPSPNAISTGTYWNFIAALRSDGHLMAIDQGCQGNVASFDSAATLWYAPLRAMSEPMPLEALAVAVRTAFGARALFGAGVDLVFALRVAGAGQPAPGCYAFRQRFDGRLARWELEHFVEHGIETRHGQRLPAAERAALLTALAPLAEPFERATPVLAHRDFHAWNLHVHDGRLRLIDFQDALLAPDAYDVASLLTDRTTAELVPPALETSLLERFVRGRAAAGVPVEPGFSERYRRCALQRALKVIG